MPDAIDTACDSIAHAHATCILQGLAVFRGTLLASERLIDEMGPACLGWRPKAVARLNGSTGRKDRGASGGVIVLVARTGQRKG